MREKTCARGPVAAAPRRRRDARLAATHHLVVEVPQDQNEDERLHRDSAAADDEPRHAHVVRGVDFLKEQFIRVALRGPGRTHPGRRVEAAVAAHEGGADLPRSFQKIDAAAPAVCPLTIRVAAAAPSRFV